MSDDDLDAFFDEVDADVEKVVKENDDDENHEESIPGTVDDKPQKSKSTTTIEDTNHPLGFELENDSDRIAPPATKKPKISHDDNNHNNNSSSSHNRNGGVVVVSKSAVTSVVASVVQSPATDLPSYNNINNNNSLNSTIGNRSGSTIKPPLPPGPPPNSSSNFHYYNNNNANHHSSSLPNPLQPSSSQPQPPQPQPMDEKMSRKVIKRSSAGQTWEDSSLAQFPANDFRLFVGNLAKDITDVKLAEAFQSKYASFAMAKVIFNKQDGKSKGYGFVSLMDPKDCARAIREMDQSWIGSRPIKVKRSDWKERSYSQVMKNNKKKHKKRNNWL